MDRALYRLINRIADRTTWAHDIFTVYAKVGVVLFAILLVVSYLDARHRGDHMELASAVWSGFAAVVALGIGQLIGNAVDRLRPYETMSDVHVLISRTTDFSFPSDHATVAGAVAAGIFFANRKWGIIAVVAAVLMAFTRVYVGAHYPTDVLVGLGLGAIVVATGRITVVPVLGRFIDWLSHTRLRPLLTSKSSRR
ncbi:MAG: phosphatase PAP2 family protein [Actinomycetota bacterium]